MSVDRAALYAAKLRALVKGQWPAEELEMAPFPGGAAARDGRRGFVLAEELPARALGGALAWGIRRGVDELHVLAPDATGHLARRALLFAAPPSIWRVDGAALTPAAADPVPPERPVPDVATAFEAMIVEAGAEPVVEGGVLSAEVLGLEVGRVVVDGPTARLQAGVGKHDREANLLANAEQSPAEALARTVRVVREHRVAGSLHELAMLAAERWLRAVVIAHPHLAGATTLVPVPSPVVRDDLRVLAPAPAAGVDAEDRPILVVCSTGVDVDLVPAAADAWLRDGRRPRLVLVLPASDVHPVTRAVAGALAEPAAIVEVDGDWRALPVT